MRSINRLPLSDLHLASRDANDANAEREPRQHPQSERSQLADLVDSMADTIDRGEPFDVDALTAKYPDLDRPLRAAHQSLIGLREMAEAATALGDPASPQAAATRQFTLGDFRILRELGRGGMGVVYEAEQISLGRRVAIKVLPFASMLDQRQLQRFKNEARAAAMLKHPNIVSVHSVGCERSVHFYAMELIEGMSLAEAIGESRDESPESRDGEPPVSRDANAERGPRQQTPSDSPSSIPHSPFDTDVAALSTQRTTNPKRYFESIAQLGIQAARALHYAHQEGVIHRDIKPSNLMLDADGNIHITDFGLARIASDASMTMTGDLVGTLRYMSPEQLDDDALVATPLPPSRHARAIPRDLETIILKSIAKEPTARYASATDLANDLKNFLTHRPISARRQSRLSKTVHWARRNRTVAMLSAIALLLLLTLAIGGSIAALQQAKLARQAEVERDRANRHVQLGCRLFNDAIAPMFWLVAHGPRGKEAREMLSTKALKFYETLDEHASNDPAVKEGLARTLLLIAHSEFADGGNGESFASRAIAIARQLVTEAPNNTDYRLILANGHNSLGNELLKESRHRDGCRELRQAVVASRRAMVIDPSNLETRRLNLAHASEYANALAMVGNIDDAQEYFELAFLLAEDFEPADLSAMYPRVHFHQSYPRLLMDLGRYNEAARHLDEARRLVLFALDNPGSDYGQEPLYEFWLAEIGRATARWKIRTGDWSGAESELVAAINRYESIAAQVGTDVWVWSQYELGHLHYDLAVAQTALGKFEPAIASHKQAASIWQTGLSNDEFKIGWTHWQIGEIYHALGKIADAEHHFSQAAMRLEQFRDHRPNELFGNSRLVAFLTNCPIESFRNPQRAIQLTKHVLTDSNGPLQLQLGLAQYRAGHFADARKSIKQSMKNRNGGDVIDRLLLAAVHHQQGNTSEAKTYYEEAEKLIAENRPIHYGHIGILGFRRIQEEVRTLLD